MVGRRREASMPVGVTAPSKREFAGAAVRGAATAGQEQLLILPSVPADDAAAATHNTSTPDLARPPETQTRPTHTCPATTVEAPNRDDEEIRPGARRYRQTPFPWLGLPLEIRELVMDVMPIPDLYMLQEAFPEPSIAVRLEKRTAAVRPLFDAMASSNQKETPLPRQFTARSDLDLFLAGLPELPAEAIAEMRSLTTLDLRCNMLTSLPDTLKSCDRLKALYLVKNPLGPLLPPIVPRLASLELLWLGGFPLVKLPETIGDTMESLREVYIYGCPIQSVPASLVRRLSSARKRNPPKLVVRLEVYNSALEPAHREVVVDALTKAKVTVVIAAS